MLVCSKSPSYNQDPGKKHSVKNPSWSSLFANNSDMSNKEVRVVVSSQRARCGDQPIVRGTVSC